MSQFLKSPVREIRTPGSVGVGPPNGGPSTRSVDGFLTFNTSLKSEVEVERLLDKTVGGAVDVKVDAGDGKVLAQDEGQDNEDSRDQETEKDSGPDNDNVQCEQ